ncbi:MAG: DUF4124 domain-containing protein [Methyloprofundus sp.]|nr:DUF4124 domain-containing protein [Methyloprofundus sp.]
MRWFILLIAFSGVVHAKAYKCEVNGSITYSQSPCPKGDTAKVILSAQDRSKVSQDNRANTGPYFPKELIEKQFDPQTGGHFKLIAITKENLRNPARFEHVSSKYTDNKNGTLTVDMNYLAENDEDSIELKTVRAITDISNGRVLQQIQ